MLQQNYARDLQKDKELGNWLFILGSDLKVGRSRDGLTLEELETHLSKVDQSDWSLNWTLEPAMLALVQARFLEHPGEKAKLIIASCFSDILRIVAPLPPYNDDIMKRVFQLIVECYSGLHDTQISNFNRRLVILDTMAKIRSYVIMLHLEQDGLILKMCQFFFINIREHHPQELKANM